LSLEIKQSVLAASVAGEVDLFTDVRESPTGMPFKVVETAGSISDPEVYRRRTRVCDLRGYLRQPYAKPDGSTGYHCLAEPEKDHVRKGGALADTVGRKCLCNGLFSAIGLGQRLTGDSVEPAIVTAGEDVAEARRFLRPGRTSYSAADVGFFARTARRFRDYHGVNRKRKAAPQGSCLVSTRKGACQHAGLRGGPDSS
jgi:nitronate monooxygenase